MSPKEYLQQYRRINRGIDCLLEEQAKMRALAERVSPKNPDADCIKIPQAVEKIFEIEEKINQKIDELADLRSKIEVSLSVLPEGKEKEVLCRRYLQGQKWEEIALAMHYSYVQVCRIHGHALLRLEKML